MNNFQLDERLEADSLHITKLWLCDLRIMKDANYPWLLLVPRQNDLVEIIDLKPDERLQLMLEISKVSEALKEFTGCHKLNVAQLGNMVRQLHVHVIARTEDDAAWPGPVWGVAEPKEWDDAERDALMAQLKDRLALPADRKA
ncbi:HIT family protein [Coralliovum pocilloporae]|uniref:HIT family protein n=1 Tax=Coralliovum pocilloporae TaxID=3066369 RepID=UPI003307C3E9